MKMHLRDIRLHNNAGMDFPVCKAGARLLDLDASRYPTADSDDYRGAADKGIYCQHCLRAWNRRYGSWAPIVIERRG